MDYSHIDLATKVVSHRGGNAGLIDALFSAQAGPALGTEERVRGDAEIYTLHGNARGDAAVVSNAGGFAREFNASRAKLIGEPRKALNSFRLFAADRFQPPPGARTHTVGYQRNHGEAAVYRDSNTDIPGVGGAVLEDKFNLWPIVTSFQEDFFGGQTMRFAGRDPRARDVVHGRRVIEELIIRINWYGLDSAGLFGALNYPRGQRRVSATAFDGTASAAAMLAELNSAANFVSEASGNAFRINRVAMSPAVRNLVMQTRLGSVNDTTVGEQFLKTQLDISTLDVANELADTTLIPGGGAGIHAIFLYDDDPDSISRIQPMGITMIRPYLDKLSTIQPMGAITGGIVQAQPGACLVLLVEV